MTEREAAEQRMKTLLQGVDLELSPREEPEVEVTNLARERASSGKPAGIRRKFVEAPAETEVTGQFRPWSQTSISTARASASTGTGSTAPFAC
jgi:hypothetical protein